MKKTYTIYGNCQSTVLAACLARVSEFRSNFSYVRWPYCHRMTKSQYSDLKDTISSYDLLISQVVSNEFRGGGYGSQALLQRCPKSIIFPSLQFYGYFPSLSRLIIPRQSDKKLIELKSILKAFGSFSIDSLYHYNDIKVMFREGLDTSVLCKRFDSGSSTEFNLGIVLEKTLGIMKSKEDSTENAVRISSFIEANWRSRWLFYTPRHPSGFVLAEVTKQIVNKLGFNITQPEYDQIARRDHFATHKLYVPLWIRKNYFTGPNSSLTELDYTLSCADTVSLLSKVYKLFPELL